MSGFSEQAPEGLRQFQQSYGLHLRTPKPTNAILRNISPRRSQIYEDLLFNNLCGFINNCFPVAKSLFSHDQWLSFSRFFFRDWRCETPYFSEIPSEFVAFMQSARQLDNLPPWLGELLEYEWLELKVDMMNTAPIRFDKVSELAEKSMEPGLFTTPTLVNRSFEWPVHRISSECIPNVPEATFLVLYRNLDNRVQFMELNAMTAGLLEIFKTNACTASEALNELAELTQYPNPEQLIAYGAGVVNDFVEKGILISYQSSSENFIQNR